MFVGGGVLDAPRAHTECAPTFLFYYVCYNVFT